MSEKKEFHTLSVDNALIAAQSSATGLTGAEVQKRLDQYGPNKLPEGKRRTWLFIFATQFRDFLTVILFIATIISYALHEYTDVIVILSAIIINVIVGFIQEMKAERALEALHKVITIDAKVLRDGQEVAVKLEDLVPGDIILINAGDKIPADARLIEINDFEVNEAPLTGESVAIEKQQDPVDASAGVGDRTNMVFLGTTATKGSAKALVVHTGAQTEIGRIAELLKTTKDDKTPLQKKLDRFSRNIGIVIIVVSALVLVIGLVKGMRFVEIFTTAVAVAVSAIPEGLVVGVTIILAIGMQRILKRGSLVRNLQAAETLGSTSVICTDKTGTITEGKMQVVALVTHDYHFKDFNVQERTDEKGLKELLFVLNIGMLCNDGHILHSGSELEDVVITGNFTDRAMLQAGMNLDLDVAKLLEHEPRLDSIPFSSKIKYMATLHEQPKKKCRRIYMKGAPEIILDMSSKLHIGAHAENFSASNRKKFEKYFNEFSSQGLRILAFAYQDVPADMDNLKGVDCCTDVTFVGFAGIKDPLRPSIKETFEKTKEAGIRTVLITGDHKLTAQAIAREIGLPSGEKNILEGEELHQMTQAQLNARVEEISVYARVSPEDKLNIIEAWRQKDKVVAMTGDGVNDSPALKAADIGIALGSGTDVAKEVSDIVILDDNYKTIIAAVEEGRGIFDNIRKVVMYLVSDSFSEVILISLALFIGIPLPLVAAQILWINLVADGLPDVALTIDPRDKAVMKEQPRSLKEPVMNFEMKLLVAIISIVTGLSCLAIFWLYWHSSGDVDHARSVVFATLTLDSLLYVYSVRSLRHSIFHRSTFNNVWLHLSVVLSLGLTIMAFYVPFLQKVLRTVPLGWEDWGVVIAVSIGVMVIIEIIKYAFIVSRKRHLRVQETL
ncbi:MAG: HAD-IC family P-type ATPase [Candidatus Kerfeldbacteria bacterium]